MAKKKNEHPGWGGHREGAGSEPMYKGKGAMVTVSSRMTTEQRDTFRTLGGTRWLRDYLDKAKQG